MEQLTLPGILPVGYLPCSNPELVEGYLSIKKILNGDSGDFDRCDECKIVLCDHALDEKREDYSYCKLVEHFRNGGMINQPICYTFGDWERICNGHHRLAAALDAGFTHIPYQTAWGEEYDWAEQYSFKLITE